MSKEKRRVPKLRFPGFTEDWEQRKLGDIATITGGGTPSTNISEYWNGDIDWYSPAEIGEQRYASGSIRKITKLGLEKSSAKILPIGTVLFTSRAGIGNTAILQVEGCTNQGFQSITPNSKELDTYFLYTMTPKLKRYGEVTGAGSTFVEVSGKQMEQMNLMIPSLDEQKHVSQLFKVMDDAITLHQRKLEHLNLKKKALLQKLFPKNGECYPELRFPGFTDAWEQRKLSDILVERNEQQVETSEYPLMSFVQGIGVTPKGERYDRSFLVLDQLKKYKRTELGDFIYSSNNLETGSIGINKTGKAVISPVYSIFYGVSIGDSEFIGIMSLLPGFIAKMIRFRQGVVYGQWRIHEKDFLDISVSIPSVDERTKITKLILSIEELITLHQRKLEHLQLQKKALLQQMFV